VASRIVIVLAAALWSPLSLAQTSPTERCDRTPGLMRIMTQWQTGLERARGQKFLPPPPAQIETNCTERQWVFAQWTKGLDGWQAQPARWRPNAKALADCRTVVKVMRNWQNLLTDLPGEPELYDAGEGIKCTGLRGGTNAPSKPSGDGGPRRGSSPR